MRQPWSCPSPRSAPTPGGARHRLLVGKLTVPPDLFPVPVTLCVEARPDLFTGIGGEGRKRAGFAKITDAQITGPQCLNVGVVKQSVHPSIMSGRIMCLARSACERQKRWARSGVDPLIGTTRRAAMVPCNEPDARGRNKTVPLPSRTARTVIHRITTLPLLLDRAFENGHVVGLAEKRGEQAVFVTSTGGTIRNLRRVVRRPPSLVWTG